jgi:hypothetical protein
MTDIRNRTWWPGGFMRQEVNGFPAVSPRSGDSSHALACCNHGTDECLGVRSVDRSAHISDRRN